MLLLRAALMGVAFPQMETKTPRQIRELLVADAEVLDQHSGTSIKATSSDVSLGGCYLETQQPMPVSTAVQLKMSYNESSLTVFGDVVRCDPGKGMAVRFRALQHNQTAKLKGWFFFASRS